MTIKDILSKYFGFNEFRSGQEEIINSILNKNNVLAIMPTGAGKSLCYQIPAIMQDNFSIVISPLISLMKDQVDNLNKYKKIASFINSSLDYQAIEKVLNDVAQNKIKIIYISPEKLENTEFVNRLKNLNPDFLIVDEAHCISEWGHSFRPSYRRINKFKEYIGIQNIAAFTATATPEVRDDILNELGMKNPKLFIYGFERKNLSLHVYRTSNKKEKLLELIKENEGPAIVYTSTRRHTEGVARFLTANKINTSYYHAGITNELRRVIQDDFVNERVRVIVATSAFGMGIDKKNIRTVIHYNIPSSIENLYQEFGRAGRDGNSSNVYLLFKEKDIDIQRYFINTSTPTAEQVRTVYDTLYNVANIAVSTVTDKVISIDKNLINILKAQKISIGLLTASLKLLEEAGYLKSMSGYDNFQYIKINLLKNDLFKFLKSIQNNTVKDIIYILLREFGNTIFNSLTKLNIANFEKILNLSSKAIEENLELLNNVGVLTYEKPSSGISVKMTTERVISKNLKIDKKKLEWTKTIQLNKLEKIVEYAQTEKCRFQFILNYFGENNPNFRCGKCDNCLGLVDELKPISNYVEEIIIRTLHENKRSLRAKHLYGILSGKSKSESAKTFTTFGICAHYSRNEIENALQKLILEKKVKTVNDFIFLDEAGISDLVFIEETKQNSSKTDYEENLILFNKLREQRKIVAQKYNQPPNIICPDDMLRQIAKIKPTSPTKILSISGFNQRMFNKIGIDILSIIDEHIANYSKDKKAKNKLSKDIYQTYELIKKGYKLEDIANLLKLPMALISLHIESILEFEPELNITTLLDQKEFELISEKIESGTSNLKELKSQLPSGINYAKIRIVLTKKRLFSSSK